VKKGRGQKKRKKKKRGRKEREEARKKGGRKGKKRKKKIGYILQDSLSFISDMHGGCNLIFSQTKQCGFIFLLEHALLFNFYTLLVPILGLFLIFYF
jgi:hypothetical protein